MKRTRLLNSELNYEISRIGHTASITLCDAGLPIPAGVKRIDLAIERGYPSFVKTLDALLSEMMVEEIFVASEIHQKNPDATGTEISQLWDAFDADTSKARSQYGQQAGLGGAWYFCVRGQGTVDAVEKNRAILSIANSLRRACLELGVVVDNTVREAVGVKASEFANSQDFNAVSTELNRQVEQEVIAPNREWLKPGAVVDFVGCAKIGGKSGLDPLCLIPIRLQVGSSSKRTNAGAAP